MLEPISGDDKLRDVKQHIDHRGKAIKPTPADDEDRIGGKSNFSIEQRAKIELIDQA